ncbi:hypothetical protein ACIHCV_45280 [Streptomyces sp. NPDC051956]|uniref:hypothetical protein n=1 Tax=Streptomyces sp. NPDC051956 TaxID=3365677 RepID=UPI0037D4050D
MGDLIVLADAEGHIRAAVMADPPQEDAVPGFIPFAGEIEPGPGDVTHRVSLPDELRGDGALASLGNYRLEMRDGETRLTAAPS